LEEAVALLRRALECRGVEAAVQSNLITTLHYLPDAGHDVIAAAQEEWNRRFGDPVKQLVPPHANDRNSERRLRIGYVSADFRDHTMGRNLLPLFRHHDRQGFEIICYSGATKPDALTAEFQRRADRWRGTVGVSDPALAEMIRQDEVDILVDLALHSGGNRLLTFAREPAPVQVSFAGYPGTTGLSGIGYHVSDRFLESGAEARSGPAWESVCLIESFWCYDPCGMELSVNDLPARKTGRLTFGSLNNFCKINGPVLKLWARVLREVADSRLLMLSPEGGHRQQVLATLGGQGVCEERVQFVTQQPRQEYLELYHQVDLMLDPFPYNGHTTSLDALWMGVPVVSLAGEQIVSRAGLSQLSNLGLPELVAFSEDDYVKIAVKLAHDLPRLAELRAMLRARMEGSVLMDGACFAQGIERAYRTLWRRWCAGESSALSKGGDSPTKAASHAP
jgi:predicted O-linked N-acetylglucosamine transferase (SPINDLY family)